jgi:predicted NAD/FAD-binding protein
MRVAVIGSGISGLAAALRLTPSHRVTLFEAQTRAGGHTHTVDIDLDGIQCAVDTGFLVYNERTYPNLIALFDELQVPTAPSDMSFSVSVGPRQIEWCGSSLASVFAQPSNALRPAFWRMLADIVRFNRQASELARQAHDDARLQIPLARFLADEGYGKTFRDQYLLPMAAAIWSCPMQTMQEFPLGSFVRFFANHGLLQVSNRPQWFTVAGGARQYVDRIVAQLADVRLGCPVLGVDRRQDSAAGAVGVRTAQGTDWFDHVVLACHSTQSLRLLSDADSDEREVLGAIAYQPNDAWLHTDSRLMPKRRRAWAAWNYLSDGGVGSPRVSVTYWLNRLQPLPVARPVFVSLNPLQEPDPAQVIARIAYEHPVFDQGATRAQQRLDDLQGRRNTWFAGAWTGYGFHEDGLKSGLAVAGLINALRAPLARAA